MTQLPHVTRLLAPGDYGDVAAVAQRFFDAERCLAVEVERQGGNGASRERWEPRVLVFRSASLAEAVEAIGQIIGSAPERRIRFSGYLPSELTPAASPAPVVCSPATNGERPVAA
jgi:hypothetical protein